ncbi:AAA ATPase domain-containing protein [Ensifer adhaerens]|nr:AAA ATPase domain-containing protein [Ensifer adhaerens]HZG29820.1 ATP-binding protein [Ensifer sp.]
MDPVRNPFAPGAGSQPPELAGRDEVIANADVALQRVLQGKSAQSQILLGLRGVGKTVLLNKIEAIAEERGYLTSLIEAPEDRPLPALLYPMLQQTLRKLSLIETAKAAAYFGMRALRSFAKTFKVEVGDFSIAVDPEPGVADSGNLEFDLPELFVRIGEAAKAAGRGWVLLIDELQYLKQADLSALIVATHKITQRNLPVLVFGAGLPQIASLSGDAKSYAERLFSYPRVGALPEEAAIAAVRNPIEDEGERISSEALAAIFAETRGYPYYLQEWGYQAWNLAEKSPIGPDIAKAASKAALRRLDEGFFKVRYDRLTPKERDYVRAMAGLGRGPYKSSEVADALGDAQQRFGPIRASIIKKGMIYSPSYGEIDFTVPLFSEYLQRQQAG